MVRPPDVFEDLVLAHDASLISRQISEDFEFGARQSNRRSASEHSSRREVDDEIAGFQNLFAQAPGALQQGADAPVELDDANRRGQDVVGAPINSFDEGRFLPVGANHQQGAVEDAAQVRHIVAVEAVEVRDDGGAVSGGKNLDGGGDIRRFGRNVELATKGHFQRVVRRAPSTDEQHRGDGRDRVHVRGELTVGADG